MITYNTISMTREDLKASLTEQIYLSNKLSAESCIHEWNHYTIFLKGPLGFGKSRFINNNMVNAAVACNKHIMICSNRRALNKSNENDVITLDLSYEVIDEYVTVISYQRLMKELEKCANYREFFKKYDIIVLDECHYFVQDSDFSGNATYELLQLILRYTIGKTRIFLSATWDDCEDAFEKFIYKCDGSYIDGVKVKGIKKLDFMQYERNTVYKYHYFMSIDLALDFIRASGKKTVMFVDDKNIKDKIGDTVSIYYEKNEVCYLNAANSGTDKNSKIIDSIVYTGKLIPSLLITTSVLDNGISIKDPEVENIIISTNSKTEFLQMLGRIRKGYSGVINVIFIRMNPEELKPIINELENKVEFMEEQRKRRFGFDDKRILYSIYSGSKFADYYRSSFVKMKYNNDFFHEKSRVYSHHGDEGLVFNYLSYRKTTSMLKAVKNDFVLACNNPVSIAINQMSWLGANEEDLLIHTSSILRDVKEEVKGKLLEVVDYTPKELTDIKKMLVDNYMISLLIHIDSEFREGRSMSNGKLEKVCNELGLILTNNGKTNGRLYTIILDENIVEEVEL